MYAMYAFFVEFVLSKSTTIKVLFEVDREWVKSVK